MCTMPISFPSLMGKVAVYAISYMCYNEKLSFFVAELHVVYGGA